MSISIISQAHITGTGLVNVFTSSATAIAGDVMELALQYKNDAGAIFTPVWNGQSFIELAPRVSAAGFFFHRFYLIAASSATANITGGTSPTYTYLNRAWRVWRSSTSSFATPPFKAGSYQASNFTSGSYVNPNITNTLTSADVVSAVFASPNWNTGYGTGTATFTEDAPSVNIGECVSTAHAAVEILRSFYTEGTGSVASALTKTGAHNPMYQFSTVILQETAYLVTSINGGSPITAGQTGIAIIASGFTAKPTAVTATYAAGAKSITATIDSGGTATNFNISIQDRIEAEDWPVNGDTLTFTFTYLSESASGTQTLVKKASETVLTVSGGITSDPATWTYWLNDDGFTVEGGEHDYIPYGDLVLTADGGGSATNTGTFTSWFRPSTGTGAGNVYAYTWVITEAGISPAGSGLTSSGLTVSGLTIAGLTSPGL